MIDSAQERLQMTLFVYDRLIDASEFCNFKRERQSLLEAFQNGGCVKLFAPRNFGKTSLVKNIVSKEWVEENESKRVFVYVELYSVVSLEDISVKVTQAFNKAISSKKSLSKRLGALAKSMAKLRPTWQPPTGEGSNPFGEFSIRTEDGHGVVPFPEILETANRLQLAGTFEFAFAFDEFQEVAHVQKAEALLRDALQNLSPKIPIVICGSKQHLLQRIFEQPKRPFHKWGNTVELRKIPVTEYTEFLNSKFNQVGLNISDSASDLLQQRLNFVPEQINRVCDFMAQKLKHCGWNANGLIIIEEIAIEKALKDFVEESASLYSNQFAALEITERKVVIAIASMGIVQQVNSKDFLRLIPNLTAASVSRIVTRLLDSGTIQEIQIDRKRHIRLEDPLLAIYIKESGLMLGLS
jgi:hypothetical protein